MKPQTPKPKAYSYLRFSTAEQSKGDSLRRQTELAADYAAEHGLELDDSLNLKDLGVSGFTGANAETGALRRFLQAIEDGIISRGSYLLVENLDRLTRANIISAQGLFLQIIGAGVVLVTLQDRREYSEESINSNPVELIISILTMMRGHDESLTKSRRLRAVWRAKRDVVDKKLLTSRAPAWLRVEGDTFVVIPNRAKVVQQIFRETAAGRGQNLIASELNRQGVPPFGRGQYWHRSYVHKILRNQSVIGVGEFHTLERKNGRRVRELQKRVDGYYPPIVGMDLWQTVTAILGKRPKGRHATQPLKSLLSGMAVCSQCGSSLTRVQKGERSRPKLVCSKAKAGAGCEYKSISQEQVEDALVLRIGSITNEAPSGDASIDEELDELRSNITGHGDQLAELAEQLGRKPSATIRKKLDQLEEELEQLRVQERTLLAQQKVSAGAQFDRRLSELAKAFDAYAFDADKTVQNSALRAVIKSIVIERSTQCLLLNWWNGGVTSVDYTGFDTHKGGYVEQPTKSAEKAKGEKARK